MQDSRTESEARHCWSDSSGKGSFTASMAAPPMRASVISSLKPHRLVRAARTSLVAVMISGPMPSPGRMVIL